MLEKWELQKKGSKSSVNPIAVVPSRWLSWGVGVLLVFTFVGGCFAVWSWYQESQESDAFGVVLDWDRRLQKLNSDEAKAKWREEAEKWLLSHKNREAAAWGALLLAQVDPTGWDKTAKEVVRSRHLGGLLLAYRLADKAATDGRYEEALGFLREIQKKDKKGVLQAEVGMLEAQILIEQKRFPEALQRLQGLRVPTAGEPLSGESWTEKRKKQLIAWIEEQLSIAVHGIKDEKSSP